MQNRRLRRAGERERHMLNHIQNPAAVRSQNQYLSEIPWLRMTNPIIELAKKLTIKTCVRGYLWCVASRCVVGWWCWEVSRGVRVVLGVTLVGRVRRWSSIKRLSSTGHTARAPYLSVGGHIYDYGCALRPMHACARQQPTKLRRTYIVASHMYIPGRAC